MLPTVYLIVNFGGPRSLSEVEPFLNSLLTDKDVIETALPQCIHNYIFGRVAKKRAKKISHDYEKIGGKSPIWDDTEYVAEALRAHLKAPVVTFHRYLPSTHASFIKELSALTCSIIKVFPMFPQFTYATTGSIARFFQKTLPEDTLRKFRWVKSYASHPAFLDAFTKIIDNFLKTKGIPQEEVCFLFSAHGLPKIFIERGDLYEFECQASYEQIMGNFPAAEGILCYQSQFGKQEWLRPYTADICENIEKYTQRKYCVFVPLSFTSDHIETLFEVEEQYMPLIAQKGKHPFRAPAFNRTPEWIEAIARILGEASFCSTSMLIRK